MSKNPTDPITLWISEVKAGNKEVLEHLWRCFFNRLERLVERKMGQSTGQIHDAEDAVLSAFDTFWCRASNEKFPELSNRKDLWNLLAKISIRKAIKHRDWENAKQRGPSAHQENASAGDQDSSTGDAVEQFPDPEPPPDVLVQFSEEFKKLVGSLDKTTLQVALLRERSLTYEQVAAELDITTAKVFRCVRKIEKAWNQEDPS